MCGDFCFSLSDAIRMGGALWLVLYDASPTSRSFLGALWVAPYGKCCRMPRLLRVLVLVRVLYGWCADGWRSMMPRVL